MRMRVASSVRLAALALALWPCAEGRAADVFLETTRSEFRKIPIWVMGFGNTAGRQGRAETPGETMAAVLTEDLRRTQLFDVIKRPAPALDLSDVHCLGKAALAEVRASEAAVVTWGRLGRQNGRIVFEVCAHDKGGKDIAVGKRYRGALPASTSFLRRMAHRWADALVTYYTGEPGMAETRIVYVAGNDTGQRALYVMDYDGFGPRRITTPRTLALMPAWLPDRRSVVYMTYQRNTQEIVQLDLHSRAVRTLVPPENLNITPALSPDGHLVAYASATQGNSDVFTMDVRTKEKRQLTRHPSADLSPTWSPDGRTLAFVSDRGGGPQIYTMNVDGSRVRRLTFDGSYNAAPVWSPRGDWIAYVCRGPTAGFRLCRISPDGRRRVQITDGAHWAMEDSPSWAPDGRHLVFSVTQGGQSHLYLINVDGTGREQLTGGALSHSSPDWSPS